MKKDIFAQRLLPSLAIDLHSALAQHCCTLKVLTCTSKRTNNNSTRVKSWVFYLHRYNWWNGPPLITELADLFHLGTFDIDYIVLKNFCFFTHQTEKSRSQSRKVSSSWSCKGAGTPSNPSRQSPIWNSCSARTLAWFGHLNRIWHNADLMFCLNCHLRRPHLHLESFSNLQPDSSLRARI